MKTARWILAAAALGAACAWGAAGDERVDGTMGADRFTAGGTIRQTTPVAGDLLAAGGTVEMDAPVRGDAIVFGGNVRVGGNVGQNLYCAGGRLTIDAVVARNARIAGGKVQIGNPATIGGNLSIAGGNVTIRGNVSGHVQAAGGEVTIDGPVGGDVVVSGGRLVLGPAARIGGNVSYRGDNFSRDPAAVVGGRVDRAASSVESSLPLHLGVTGGWIWSAGLLLLAALFAAAVPPASMRVAAELRARPWLALLYGFIALVCFPVAAILLMVTVIGIPLAMVVLLCYLILLVMGYVATAVGIGDAAVARYRPADSQRSSLRVPAAVAAMLALALVARIPFVGGFVVVVATLLGLGAILLALRPRKEAPVAPV
jgi:hypothetical protein